MARTDWRDWVRHTVERLKVFVEFERVDAASGGEVRASRVDLMRTHKDPLDAQFRLRASALGLDEERARAFAVHMMPWAMFSIYLLASAELCVGLPEPHLTLATILAHGGLPCGRTPSGAIEFFEMPAPKC